MRPTRPTRPPFGLVSCRVNQWVWRPGGLVNAKDLWQTLPPWRNVGVQFKKRSHRGGRRDLSALSRCKLLMGGGKLPSPNYWSLEVPVSEEMERDSGENSEIRTEVSCLFLIGGRGQRSYVPATSAGRAEIADRLKARCQRSVGNEALQGLSLVWRYSSSLNHKLNRGFPHPNQKLVWIPRILIWVFPGNSSKWEQETMV